MKVVLMSDSHGCNDKIDDVLKQEQDGDLFLHCGDICVDRYVYPQLLTVLGNNDYYDYPKERFLEIETHHLVMFHSHQFPCFNKKERMIAYAKKHDCDILCYGHTHVAHYEFVDGVHIINPGSLYCSRDGKPISYAILNVTTEKVDVLIKYINE